MSRLLEPHTLLGLYDEEHVLVTVYARDNAESPATLELVLEDAALIELERERQERRRYEAGYDARAEIRTALERALEKRPDLAGPLLDKLNELARPRLTS